MADEVLSQAELETLLSNATSGLAPRTRDSAGHPLPAPHAAPWRSPPGGRASEVTLSPPRLPPDADPANRISEESMAAVRALNESFARGASAALSVLVRSTAEIKLVHDEQTTYGQAVTRLQNPTCASVVRAGSLAAQWLLEISPVLYAIIDRLLGGGREPGVVARRPLTDIELRLAARITRSLLEELAKAWRRAAPLELVLDRVESNPRLALIAAAHESVILANFEARIGDVRGTLLLCIPSGSLESIAGSFVTLPGHNLQPVSRSISGPAVELVVQLAETKILAHDLANLRVGDVITTEKDVRSPLTVCVPGIAPLVGHPGAIGGRKAVIIEAPGAEPPGSQKAP